MSGAENRKLGIQWLARACVKEQVSKLAHSGLTRASGLVCSTEPLKLFRAPSETVSAKHPLNSQKCIAQSDLAPHSMVNSLRWLQAGGVGSISRNLTAGDRWTMEEGDPIAIDPMLESNQNQQKNDDLEAQTCNRNYSSGNMKLSIALNCDPDNSSSLGGGGGGGV